MPFGLKNAPMIFQRAIWNILETHNLTQFCHNYLDDIIIFSKTYEEHISHVHAVLKALQNSNAILKFSKCQLLKNSVIYLGHRISKNQVQPLDNNIEAILKVERPKDVKGVKSFLGQINYYHRFIENRYKILQPLIDLTKKNAKFVWGDQQEEAFNKIKSIISQKPILKIFDPAKEILIYTDASQIGVAAVLKQEHNGVEHPVSFFSRKLMDYQKNYSVTELECLALISALDYWHYWVFGKTIKIFTDHKPLEGIRKNKQPGSRLFNWAIKLSGYPNLTIHYKPGETNEADFLSRHPINIFIDSVLDHFKKNAEIMMLDTKSTSSNCDRIQCEKLITLDYINAQDMLKQIHHKYGHIGTTQMLLHYNTMYQSKDAFKIAQDIVNQCITCQHTKHNHKKFGTLGQIGPASKPFDIIHIDTIGGFKFHNSKKKYLHLAIDAFSRFVWGLASRSQTATDFVNLVNKICDQQKPKLIVSDQFSSLKSSIFKKFLKHQGISLMYTPVDHPASNGIVERVNQTITNRLRQKVFENRKRSWSSLVLECINEYNATIHTVTKFPPNYLMTGYDPDQLFQDQPLETNRFIAFDNSMKSHEYSKLRYDANRKQLNLNVGDKIFVESGNRLNRDKLDPLFEGPYTITRIISKNIIEIMKKNKPTIVHSSQIKIFKDEAIEENECRFRF
ncbi:Transposon Tf2-9 polyprotein [Sarcoptes scabiei]|uniref:Transposon Tf2-9 polyprotein n=1 Tax=Sarcoptes scabiei TaxID=52283 RepID=A0A834R0C7_SARSC|nr:Transposon Tf2-9 polyprotein [Sarcoptes scabiei]